MSSSLSKRDGLQSATCILFSIKLRIFMVCKCPKGVITYLQRSISSAVCPFEFAFVPYTSLIQRNIFWSCACHEGVKLRVVFAWGWSLVRYNRKLLNFYKEKQKEIPSLHFCTKFISRRHNFLFIDILKHLKSRDEFTINKSCYYFWVSCLTKDLWIFWLEYQHLFK